MARKKGNDFLGSIKVFFVFFVILICIITLSGGTTVIGNNQSTSSAQYCRCSTEGLCAVYSESSGCVCLPCDANPDKPSQPDPTKPDPSTPDPVVPTPSKNCNASLDTCQAHGKRVDALYTKLKYNRDDDRNPLVLFVSSERKHCSDWNTMINSAGGCYQKTMYRLIEYLAEAGMTVGFTCLGYSGNRFLSPSGAIIAEPSYFKTPYFTVAEREMNVMHYMVDHYDSPLLGYQSHDAIFATSSSKLRSGHAYFSNAVRKESTERFVFMGVSQWHTLEMKKHVSSVDQKKMTYDVLYNVLDRSLPLKIKAKEDRDLNRLFFGSAHGDARKRAENIAMSQLKNDNFTLWVTGPSYYFSTIPNDHDNIHYEKPMPEWKFSETISSSLAYLYPANHPEAFGCVFAMANSMGVPVITTHRGAAPEVLSQLDEQVVDFSKTNIKDQLIRWRNDPPKLKADARFTPVAVVGKIVGILEGKIWDTNYNISGPQPDLGELSNQ
ncbi:hypothetical protein PCE1_004690 [Barthelona sp. PCE]